MSDIFREVDEELRRDNAAALWNKYGPYVIGTAIGIVVLTAAIVLYQSWQTSQAEQASADYTALQESLEGKSGLEIAEAYGDFEAATPGYTLLAGFQQAAALAEAGQVTEAIMVYERLAANSSLDDTMRQLAIIKGAILSFKSASDADLNARLRPLIAPGAPWRNLARELLGLSAYRAGEFETASTLFNEIKNDSGTAPGIRDRAHIMLALLASKVGPTEQEAP